jgi:patatin-related protein
MGTLLRMPDAMTDGIRGQQGSEMTRNVRDADRQELRLGVVMTGGVSLAVWMGGVALELDRLRTDPMGTAYAGLLDLIQADLQIDVISGTSAGGLNGALLGASIAYGTRLDLLRRTWISSGAMLPLIREPKGEPRSLMQGDEVFLPAIRDALKAVRGGGNGPVTAEHPLEVFMTASLLTAQPRNRTDRYGSVFPESTHLGLFHFDSQAFRSEDAVDRLALAARTSAAHPGGFEASYVPMKPEDTFTLHPSMEGVADWRGSRFCVDGGILLNRPLKPAVEAIFKQTAHREVRRVVLFVAPDPGTSAKEASEAPGQRPTLLTTVASVVSLPHVQSISEDLELVEEQNEQVRRRRRVARELRRAPRLSDAAWTMFGAYHLVTSQRESRRIADLLEVGVAGRAEATSTRQARVFRENLENTVETALGSVPPTRQTVLTPWRWTIASLRRMALGQLDMLTRTMAITPAPLTDQQPSPVREELRTLRRYLHEALTQARELSESEAAYWRDRRPSVIELLQQAPTPDAYKGWIEDAIAGVGVKLASDFVSDVPESDPRVRLAARLGVLMLATATIVRDAASVIAAGDDVGSPDLPFPPGYTPTDDDRSTANALLGEVAGMLASQPAPVEPQVGILGLLERLTGIHLGADVPASGCSPQLAEGTATALADSERVTQALRLLGPEGLAHQVDAWLFELLAVEVAQAPMLASDLTVDQEIELVQVSAETGNALGDPRTAARAKLTGIQLAHFGAFYKSSWRANDWMWGRLDGAFQLARVLVDPPRLRMLGYSRDEAVAAIAEVATTDPVPAVADWLGLDRPARQLEVERELAFLDDSTADAPDTLPISASWVARRLQVNILLEEMPWVAATAALDMSEGGAESTAGIAFLSAYLGFPAPALSLRQIATEVAADIEAKRRPLERELAPADAVALLGRCRIGEERIADEEGTDLFVETATKAAATAVGALRAPSSGLGLVATLFGSLRGTTLAAYYLAKAAMQSSRASLVAIALGCSLAAAVLVVALVGRIDAPNISIAVATALLIGTGAIVGLRGHNLVVLIAFAVSVTFTVLTLALTGGFLKFVAMAVAFGAIASLVPMVLRQASAPSRPAWQRLVLWAGVAATLSGIWFAFGAPARPDNLGLTDDCGSPLAHVQRRADAAAPSAEASGEAAAPALDQEGACAGINADLTWRFAGFGSMVAGGVLVGIVIVRARSERRARGGL